MPKKYIVRLTDAERQTLGAVVAKFKGSAQKVRRAQVLLKADADGPSWTDTKIADAFDLCCAFLLLCSGPTQPPAPCTPQILR